mmetsp:Transcript_23997/g.66235  ORF Transcript_23997/g.66235 Transcript_23997/m.66235 type:complete len:355 (-) Transcript_23997:1104-2168(-)
MRPPDTKSSTTSEPSPACAQWPSGLVPLAWAYPTHSKKSFSVLSGWNATFAAPQPWGRPPACSSLSKSNPSTRRTPSNAMHSHEYMSSLEALRRNRRQSADRSPARKVATASRDRTSKGQWRRSLPGFRYMALAGTPSRKTVLTRDSPCPSLLPCLRAMVEISMESSGTAAAVAMRCSAWAPAVLKVARALQSAGPQAQPQSTGGGRDVRARASQHDLPPKRNHWSRSEHVSSSEPGFWQKLQEPPAWRHVRKAFARACLSLIGGLWRRSVPSRSGKKTAVGSARTVQSCCMKRPNRPSPRQTKRKPLNSREELSLPARNASAWPCSGMVSTPAPNRWETLLNTANSLHANIPM